MHQQSSRYQAYLQSPEWDVRRREALDRFDWHCALCYADAGLEVHHRTYDRVYDERPGDLVVLCGGCHARFHGVAPRLAAVETVDEPSDKRLDEIDISGNASWCAVKLEALINNSPEFRAAWEHTKTYKSLASYELALCGMAAGAMTNAELAELVRVHRAQWGGPPTSTKSIQRTIMRARSRTERAAQIAALEQAGRRAI